MAAIPKTTSVSTWKRATQHVEAQTRSGRYVNAETALILMGPPRMADLSQATILNGGVVQGDFLGTDSGTQGQSGKDALYPVGLVEQFALQQAQAVQKIFEIGARRSYQAAGRVQVVGSMGRVMFRGASLLRACMAYYPGLTSLANGKILGPDGDSVSKAIVGAASGTDDRYPDIFFEPGSLSAKDSEDDLPHGFYMNLMSELFSFPFGICIILRDNSNKNVGAGYIEDCFINSHSFNISSSSTLITEAISFQADAWVPLEFSTEIGRLAAGSTQ